MSLRAPLRRSLAALSVGVLSITMAGFPAAPSSAESLPADYSASTQSDILDLDVSVLSSVLGIKKLAGVQLGHNDTATDTTAAADKKTRAASNNLGISLAGAGGPIDKLAVDAAPSDSAANTIIPLPIAPVLTLGALSRAVQANYTNDKACVADSGDGRVLSQAVTNLAAASVLGLPAPANLSVAEVAASTSTSTTKLVDDSSGGADVVSSTTTHIGDVSLLGGAAVVKVTSPARLTTSSDGDSASVDYSNPTVTVTLAGKPAVVINDAPGATQTVPVDVPLLGLHADVTITLLDPVDTSSGAAASATLDAVATVRVHVTSSGLLKALGPDIADVTLKLAPMKSAATAPQGGVECDVVDSDKDGLSDSDEVKYGTVDGDQDTDDDGLLDGEEVHDYNTDPTKADTDGGGVDDGDEIDNGTDPTVGHAGDDHYTPPVTPSDQDIDGLSDQDEPTYHTDPLNPDSDNDGLKDGTEVNIGTNPKVQDTDGDGIKDGVEIANGTDPKDPHDPGNGQDADPDHDGLSNAEEAGLGTDPNKADTDGDGLKDGTEVNIGTDPLKTDSDAGGVADGAEINNGTDPRPGHGDDDHSIAQDTDGDGLSDVDEGKYGTDPNNPDTDGEGLLDGTEVNIGTNPLKADTDGEGLNDNREVKGTKTDPLKADTDGDGLNDNREVKGTKTNPRLSDTDRDKLSDGYEIFTSHTRPLRYDSDGDGVGDRRELIVGPIRAYPTCKSNPMASDTDKDGLKDGTESKRTRTNPCSADTDREGLSDAAEVNGPNLKKWPRCRTNPRVRDTDRDGYTDQAEVKRNSNPCDERVTPKTVRR